MNLELDGKTVFIAGGSRGIGYGMARGFLAEGAKVAITGRGEASLDDAKDALTGEGASRDAILTVAGDMTETGAIAAALDATEEKLGPLHTVIANVGIGQAPLGYDVSDADWAADIKQNLTGSTALAREGLKRILKRPVEEREDASVLFISSIAGVEALGTSLTYGATKAALNHVTHALAKLAGRDGVRVNAIAPGNIKFPGGNWEERVNERPEAWGRWIKREVALQRFGTIDEIADAALWLSSPRAKFVTGHVLVVDGGQVRH